VRQGYRPRGEVASDFGIATFAGPAMATSALRPTPDGKEFELMHLLEPCSAMQCIKGLTYDKLLRETSLGQNCMIVTNPPRQLADIIQ
jgi:hypothetical protein